MRIAIAGAGSVGRSIAGELVENGHEVMLIDRDADAIKPERIEAAEWVLADACEVALLEDAGLQTCDVVIACTGDDKVNLVVSLLAKTEFAVGRVVGRVNDPRNEWLFTDAWGGTSRCRSATWSGCSPCARGRSTSSRSPCRRRPASPDGRCATCACRGMPRWSP